MVTSHPDETGEVAGAHENLGLEGVDRPTSWRGSLKWKEFAAAAPELAAAGRERFERAGLALVGWLRKDGWPRISPVELYIVDGDLLLG